MQIDFKALLLSILFLPSNEKFDLRSSLIEDGILPSQSQLKYICLKNKSTRTFDPFWFRWSLPLFN